MNAPRARMRAVSRRTPDPLLAVYRFPLLGNPELARRVTVFDFSVNIANENVADAACRFSYHGYAINDTGV